MEFYGSGVGSYARLYGSLSGVHQSDDQWDMIVNLVKLAKPSGFGTKNELSQGCPVASVKALEASWQYYNMRADQPSMLIGRGKNLGCNITIMWDRTSMYVAQIGFGGSEKNARFGMTGWIAYKQFDYDE